MRKKRALGEKLLQEKILHGEINAEIYRRKAAGQNLKWQAEQVGIVYETFRRKAKGYGTWTYNEACLLGEFLKGHKHFYIEGLKEPLVVDGDGFNEEAKKSIPVLKYVTRAANERDWDTLADLFNRGLQQIQELEKKR